MKNKPKKYVIRINEDKLSFNPKRCYIFQSRTINFSNDREISGHLKISIKQYRKFLIEQFSGQLMTLDIVNEHGQMAKESAVYFKNNKTARQALDWIESSTILIDQYLIGVDLPKVPW